MTVTVNGTTAKATKGQACLCGCGGVTRGGRYLPGHDSKHRSALLRDLGIIVWAAKRPAEALRPDDL